MRLYLSIFASLVATAVIADDAAVSTLVCTGPNPSTRGTNWEVWNCPGVGAVEVEVDQDKITEMKSTCSGLKQTLLEKATTLKQKATEAKDSAYEISNLIGALSNWASWGCCVGGEPIWDDSGNVTGLNVAECSWDCTDNLDSEVALKMGGIIPIIEESSTQAKNIFDASTSAITTSDEAIAYANSVDCNTCVYSNKNVNLLVVGGTVNTNDSQMSCECIDSLREDLKADFDTLFYKLDAQKKILDYFFNQLQAADKYENQVLTNNVENWAIRVEQMLELIYDKPYEGMTNENFQLDEKVEKLNEESQNDEGLQLDENTTSHDLQEEDFRQMQDGLLDRYDRSYNKLTEGATTALQKFSEEASREEGFYFGSQLWDFTGIGHGISVRLPESVEDVIRYATTAVWYLFFVGLSVASIKGVLFLFTWMFRMIHKVLTYFWYKKT